MEELAKILACLPTAQPVEPDVRATKADLKLGYNVCYIVAGVVIEDGKVLMMQEAKASCRGRWYLPAGRMEKDESIVEAVQREVLEETGLQFEPEALLAVESQGRYWVRYTFAGRVTGGSLKSPAEADKESLQAGWFPADVERLQSELPLRASDIVPLIDLARQWFAGEGGRPFSGLPVPVDHVSASYRLLTVSWSLGDVVWVLKRKDPDGSSTVFPVSSYASYSHISGTLLRCGYDGSHKVVGVVSLEHSGKPHGVHDGFCASLLITASSKPDLGTGEWEWAQVDDKDLIEQLKKASSGDFGCAKLMDLA